MLNPSFTPATTRAYYNRLYFTTLVSQYFAGLV